MYKTYSDEELRRVLATNPKDAEALVEAADRWVKRAFPEEITVTCDCPECFEEFEKDVLLADYLP